MKASTILNRAMVTLVKGGSVSDVQRAINTFRAIREDRQVRRGDILRNGGGSSIAVTVCRVDATSYALPVFVCTDGAKTWFIPRSAVNMGLMHHCRVVRKLSNGARIVERIS